MTGLDVFLDLDSFQISSFLLFSSSLSLSLSLSLFFNVFFIALMKRVCIEFDSILVVVEDGLGSCFGDWMEVK